MKTLVITMLLLTGCRLGDLPPTVVCTAQHSWENYHLAHTELSPVVTNYSDYDVDIDSWNALDTPITLRMAGNGFPITVEEGGDAGSGWLGLASVRVSGAGHITSATVTMNRTLLAKYSTNVWMHVLAQEIGHILGLDHQRGADDSAMDDCQGRGSGWLACLSSVEGTTPNAHDGEQLREIYAHAVDGDGDGPGCTGTLVVHTFAVPEEGDRHVEH